MRLRRFLTTALVALTLGLPPAVIATAPTHAADPPADSHAGHDHSSHAHGDHSLGIQFEDEHGADKGGPSPFDIFESDVMPYVWNLLMFLLLLGALMYYVWPAVLKGLREREEKIRADIQAAKNAREDAEKMRADFDRQIAEARAESAKTVAEARATADKLAEELRLNAEREIDAMRQRAKAEITSAKEAALAEVYTQTAALATDVAGKILGRSLNPDDQRDLVEQTIQQYQQN
ncbi:MAG: F0F1 ATP synthase subunit B [Planctomycetota bacterium]